MVWACAAKRDDGRFCLTAQFWGQEPTGQSEMKEGKPGAGRAGAREKSGWRGQEGLVVTTPLWKVSEKLNAVAKFRPAIW